MRAQVEATLAVVDSDVCRATESGGEPPQSRRCRDSVWAFDFAKRLEWGA